MKINSSFQQLKADPAARQAKQEQQLKNAAKMYEQHFLDDMVKAMRKTVHREGGLTEPNMAEKIFSEKLDQQYVESWANKGGIGLADMIYQQLHERIFPNKKDFSKPQGPLPLDKPAPFQIKVEKKNDSQGQILFQGEKLSPLVQVPDVQSPWAGEVESMNAADGWNHVTIRHDNQIRSQLAFQGIVSPFAIGSRVKAGENLGRLSPEAPLMRWTVENLG